MCSKNWYLVNLIDTVKNLCALRIGTWFTNLLDIIKNVILYMGFAIYEC